MKKFNSIFSLAEEKNVLRALVSDSMIDQIRHSIDTRESAPFTNGEPTLFSLIETSAINEPKRALVSRAFDIRKNTFKVEDVFNHKGSIYGVLYGEIPIDARPDVMGGSFGFLVNVYSEKTLKDIGLSMELAEPIYASYSPSQRYSELRKAEPPFTFDAGDNGAFICHEVDGRRDFCFVPAGKYHASLSKRGRVVFYHQVV